MTFLAIAGLVLSLIGGAITVCFWIPGIVNRPRIKEMLGRRYPLVYAVYFANGPLLLLLGVFLLVRFL